MLQASWAAGLTASSCHELVDEVVTGKAAHGQQQEPDDEQTQRNGAELEPATPAGEPDREGRDDERNEPHPVGDRAEDLRGRLRRLELALLDDRDLSRGLREPLGNLSDHRYLVAELDHDRTQVEHDRSALGLDERRVVVEEAHELALRPGRHLHPYRLHTRPLERSVCRPIGARACESGQDRSEPLLRGRQLLGDRRFDVDVLKQRVDRPGRDLGADLVVFDHVPRDRLEAVLVERRVLDVERDHPDDREQDREDGQYACADDPPAGRPLGLRALVRHGRLGFGHVWCLVRPSQHGDH